MIMFMFSSQHLCMFPQVSWYNRLNEKHPQKDDDGM